MTLAVAHWSAHKVILVGDGLEHDCCFIEWTEAGWHLHLEKNGESFIKIDALHLSHQSLLDAIYESMKKIDAKQLIHWPDIWMYMRIAHVLGSKSNELEDCNLDTYAMPPRYYQRVALEKRLGTHIRITYINSDDPDDRRLLGATGIVVPLIEGLGEVDEYRYAVGMKLDPEYNASLGECVNLSRLDKWEVVE